MARRERRESLAANIAVLTLMVVAVSVTIVSLAALTGVFDLASDQSAARQVAYRQAVNAELGARLDAAIRVVERVASSSVESPNADIDRAAVAAAYDAGIEYVDRVLVARADGTVLSAHPSFSAPASIAGEPYFDGTSRGVGFAYVAEEGALWVRKDFPGPEGDIVALARTRLGFLEFLLDEFSSRSARRVVYLALPDGTVVYSGKGGVALDSETSVYVPADEGAMTGSVSTLAEGGLVMSGQYEQLDRYPGLDWIIGVVEPRATLVRSTWTALLPAVLALTVSGVFSIVVATLFARRLTAPLRDLEQEAREVAAGAYGRRIESERLDEVGRLAEAFNAMALRLNALHDLTQLLASSAELGQVLDGITTAITHIVGDAGIAIFLIDEHGYDLRLEQFRGLDLSPGTTVSVRDSQWIRSALASGGPTSFVGSPSELERVLPGVSPEGVPIALAAPLVAVDRPLGVIIIVPLERRELSEAEADMIRTFSAQASVAVNISRLFAEESEARREAEALRDVAERLSTPRDLERALASVMRVAQELLGVSQAMVAFVDRTSLGLPPAADPVRERAVLRAWHAVWNRGDGDSVMRAARGDDEIVDRFLESLPAEEALFLTVLRRGEPSAVVAFVVEEPGRSFTPRERALADGIGTEITLALDTAYHFAQATARAANLETIFRISQAVSSSLQIKVVLNRVLDVVQKIFTADAVALMQHDESKRVVATVMARGLVSTEMLHFECAPGADVPGTVFLTGEPIKIDDIVDSESDYAAMAFEQGMHSLLSVPLMARGRSLGVLTVFSASVEAFSAEDRELLHTFASQAALAIDTASLYGREHHVASVLQSSILPQNLPRYPELEASSVYLPAGQEAEIGGDYFDLFRAPDGSLVMVIADVCGKGVVAATKTSMIKYSVRALVAAGLGPAGVLAEVNRMVSESADTSDIVTLLVAMIDPVAGTLRHANGGHPPALLRRAADDSIARLDTTGALLGAIPDARFDESSQSIAPGDTLVMFTDGVTEARRGNKFFGEGRVRRALVPGGTADEVVSRLLTALDKFVPGSLRDDAAVLAVRVRDGDKEQVV